jgi:phenylacetate-CoA ligase
VAKLAIENRIWDPAETLPREELRALQGRRLAESVRRAQAVPFYREALARAGVDPSAIRAPDDVRRLPFTVKDDLRRNYPLGLLAVPRAEVVRLPASPRPGPTCCPSSST